MPTPGTNAIVEVQYQIKSTDVPRDYMVNHLGFNTGAPSVTTANWQALVDAVKGVFFATAGAWHHFDDYGGRVVAYDRADAKPRPEKAFATYVPTTWATSYNTARQVCLCLSFYSARNIKRKRGRIYLPVRHDDTVAERPATTLMNQVLATGTQLNTVVTALVPSWGQSVHSDADDMDWVADHWWVNDVWDTQRRRTPKESLRVHSP